MTIIQNTSRRARLGFTAIAAALSLGAPLAVATMATPAVAAEGRLDEAVAALRSITTMTADFTQTDRQGSTVGGKLTLKQPGKIRFQYEKGVPLLIVSNGSALTMIDYEVNQVQRWPIKSSPLGALLDPDRDVKRYGKLTSGTSGTVISVEVRDPKRPEFGVMTLIFTRNASAPGGWQLTNWVALDSQNNRTTVRLRNHRYGAAVSDSAFKYRDPRRTSRRPR